MRILSFLSTNLTKKKECEMRIVLPYNVKKAYLMMLLALGLTPTFISCEKDDSQPKQHDTTYTINLNVVPTEAQVQASADSNLVRNVILKADGSSWSGVSSTVLRDRFFNKMFALSPKVQGAGNLKDVTIALDTDSLWFVQKGYTVNQKTK